MADKKNQYLMIDSTIVRAHQQAAAARKRGGAGSALGRSRGGLSTKIHLLTDEAGLPVAFRITPGQAAEMPRRSVAGGQQAEAVIADKGYDSAPIIASMEDLGAVAVIPPRRHRKQPRSYDCELYKQRNQIERCFTRLKQFRRFSTRFCRILEAFAPQPHSPAPGSDCRYSGYRLVLELVGAGLLPAAGEQPTGDGAARVGTLGAMLARGVQTIEQQQVALGVIVGG